MVLKNYALGKWTAGEGEGQALYNAITGAKIAETSSKGLDFGEMMDYAREVGGPTLRKNDLSRKRQNAKSFSASPHFY